MTDPDAKPVAELTPRERGYANLKRWPKGQPLPHQAKLSAASRSSVELRVRLSGRFLRALDADFKKHGSRAIAAVRQDDPSTYVRVVAALMPAKVDLDIQTGSVSDEALATLTLAELARRLSQLDQRRQELLAIPGESVPVLGPDSTEPEPAADQSEPEQSGPDQV